MFNIETFLSANMKDFLKLKAWSFTVNICISLHIKLNLIEEKWLLKKIVHNL